MTELTNNEVAFVLTVFKSPEVEYNANSIAKQIGISSMGALKIAKRLQNENILTTKKMGNAVFYSLNINNEYAIEYLRFLLKKEAEQAPAYIKVWINEIKKVKNVYAAILFGSVLKKHNDAKDIDVIFITNEKRFPLLKKEVEEINTINIKKIHPVYQTKEDLIKNVKKGDSVILNAIKGIVVIGNDFVIKTLTK